MIKNYRFYNWVNTYGVSFCFGYEIKHFLSLKKIISKKNNIYSNTKNSIL